MTKFVIGDTVSTNTDDREMTVVKVEQGKKITCSWNEDGEDEQAIFNPWELRIVRMFGAEEE